MGGVEVGARVAQGAHGSVYAALDLASGEARALKAEPAPETPEGCQQFLAQGERLLPLVHPGIVRVHGGGLSRGLAFLVMEWAPGADLARYTQAGRLLPEPLVLELAAQLAEALAHAHRQGLAHRDVKPANVRFDPALGRVKLADFGLARADDAQASRSGQFVGSPAYMAPELLAGAAPDAASDLYALGVLTYELLSSQTPVHAESLGELLRAVAHAAPRPLAAVRPDLPAARAAAIDALLAPLLAKAPAERLRDGDAWAARARAAAAAWGVA
jgi:serine/threonine-protein kinase